MDVRAVRLGMFFEKRNCPLKPYIDDFITAADKYDIPYNLLPAIATIESSCGKRYPPATNNVVGWNSAKSGFESIPQSIDFVSDKLANGHYYKGKSIEKKLATYCPNPTYPQRVLNIMKEIDN